MLIDYFTFYFYKWYLKGRLVWTPYPKFGHPALSSDIFLSSQSIDFYTGKIVLQQMMGIFVFVACLQHLQTQPLVRNQFAVLQWPCLGRSGGGGKFPNVNEFFSLPYTFIILFSVLIIRQNIFNNIMIFRSAKLFLTQCILWPFFKEYVLIRKCMPRIVTAKRQLLRSAKPGHSM